MRSLYKIVLQHCICALKTLEKNCMEDRQLVMEH